MYFRFLFALILVALLGSQASAQNTATPVITGYLSTSGCSSPALTPCFIQYGAGGAGTVTIGAPLGPQTAAASVAVICNSGCSGGPADESAFTAGTSSITTGGFFQTTATNNALTTGQAGSVQMTSTRSFFVNLRNNAGTEAGVAALPLQVSLANTAANATPVSVAGTGTAGTANTGVVTVQGIASMTKLLVTPDSVALPANQSVNVAQVNGVTTLTGSGGTGTGSQRVTVAGDTATVSGIAPGTVAAGAAPANTIVAGCQYNATIPAATDTQGVAVQCDPSGRLRVASQPTVFNAVSGTATQTSTTTTSLISLVASNRIYVTAFACYNSGSSASVISFQDGSGGTTLYQTIVPAGGGSNLGGGQMLFKTTAGNALFFAPATASTTIGCSASGFSAL